MKEEKDKKSSEDPEKNEPVVLSRQEHDDLFRRLQELEAVRERLLLSAADFENAKKRLAKEQNEFVKFSQENLLRNLLPVLDNFERALVHAGDADKSEKNLKSIIAGVEMVFKQLSDILKNQGLKRLKTVGEKFDPHHHEAVNFVHESGADDTVVNEIEPGYLLHDRLLRAAKVSVRVQPPEASSSEEKQEEIT